MTATAIVKAAGADGVMLALSGRGSIQVQGPHAKVKYWAPILRQHKPAVLAVLAKQGSARSWYVTVPGRGQFEVIVTPPTTIAEMRLLYPRAEEVVPARDE